MALSPNSLRDLKDTLLTGRYTLFLGAGASFESKDRQGKNLPLSEALRSDLVSLKSLNAKSSLARAYAQLSQSEIDTHLTDRFSKCAPGPALLKIPAFTCKRIYTTNIDDALEAAYKATNSRQALESKTHQSPYMEATDVNSLQLIHLHGWSLKPDDGYVFSLPEYVKTMGPNSPWTSVLAHTIATEPFIIAGTSLEEPDLEYFLAGRKSESIRKDRGPSFLVEPYPDTATLNDCERHGLTLYQGTLAAFLDELNTEFPTRPLPINATSGLNKELFASPVATKDLALFSKDFSYVVAQMAQENADLGFFVGRQPSLTDIALNRDISRASTLSIKAEVRRKIATNDWGANFLIIDDNAGSGKTTILTRSIYDLAAEGVHIFEYKCLSSPNIDLCAKIFNSLKGSFVIACDDFADHAPALIELYKKIHRDNFLIIAAERSYRLSYVFQILAGNAFDQQTLLSFSKSEAKDLIVKMDKHGLTSYKATDISRLSEDLTKDPLAIAACRIMNDFRPVDDIIESLIQDADTNRLSRYIGSALASYCYKPGIAYSLLATAFDADGLDKQFRDRDMLPLAFSDPSERDYVAPTNPVLAQRVLREVSEKDPELMFEAYCAVGAYVAPYVNRSAVKKRTPEARLSGRLFDYDDCVSEFIPMKSEDFYLRMRPHWSWNSRYWEQFALLKLDKFIQSTRSDRFDLLSQAISHARHAVKIERHPLSLTTLGRILLEEMKQNTDRFEKSFKEAFGYLNEAIKLEGQRNRIAVHPYMTMFSGANNYMKQSGKLASKDMDLLRTHVDTAETLFSFDTGILLLIGELRQKIT